MYTRVHCRHFWAVPPLNRIPYLIILPKKTMDVRSIVAFFAHVSFCRFVATRPARLPPEPWAP